MIDTSKQYTYNDRPVRIYADGADTAGGYIHGAYISEAGNWRIMPFEESDLVEVWEPKEGEWCLFFDSDSCGILLAKFSEYVGSSFMEHNGNTFECCAPFTGTLPESFKGLV